MRKFFVFSGSQNGFTLVELLVVIAVLGILAGVSFSILNPKQQRDRASDGVKMSNLEKLALGIESYANANGSYPTSLAHNATTGVPTVAEVAVFISKLPTDNITTPYPSNYNYGVLADATAFAVFVYKTGSTSDCFKYYSDWGVIKECSTNCAAVNDVCP